MIAEWETNRLSVSERLKADYLQLVASLRSALGSVEIEVILGTQERPEDQDVLTKIQNVMPEAAVF